MKRLMTVVGLTHLLERYTDLGVRADWSDVLSLGEQQRLGMARLFHHRPKFAILDQVALEEYGLDRHNVCYIYIYYECAEHLI